MVDPARSINSESYLNDSLPTPKISKNNVTMPLEINKAQIKDKKSNLEQNFFSKVGVDLFKQTKIIKQIIAPKNSISSLEHFAEQNKRKNLHRENNLIEKEKDEVDRQNILFQQHLNGNSFQRSSSIKLKKNLKSKDVEYLSDLASNKDMSGKYYNSQNFKERNVSSLIQNKLNNANANKFEKNKTKILNLSNVLKEKISNSYSNATNPNYNSSNSNYYLIQNEKRSGKINDFITNSNSQILNENVNFNYNNNISTNFNIHDYSTVGQVKNFNYFMNEFSKKSSFLNHLKMFEINLDLDDGINNYNNSNLYDNYYLNSHIKTLNKSHLFADLRRYFQIVKKEFNTNPISSESPKRYDFDFFIDENINLLYEKLTKLQMIVMAILFVFFKNLNIDDFLKVHIRKLCSCLIYPMINFYECFVINQPHVTNDHSISSYMSQNFREKYRKIYKFNRMNRYFSTKDNIFFLNKFTDELIVLIKHFPRYF
jgi:hypothetical protein